MKKIFDFFFSRWVWTVHARGQETWFMVDPITKAQTEYKRNYVEYMLANKFDGSVKIKRKYLTP